MRNIPDWCKTISKKMSDRYNPYNQILEAILYDVEFIGEKSAKEKWTEISDSRRK